APVGGMLMGIRSRGQHAHSTMRILVSGDGAARSPGARSQMYAAIVVDGQAHPNALAQYGTTIFAKRRAISRRRGLTAKKGRPVIVEVFEHRRHIDGADSHILQSGIRK